MFKWKLITKENLIFNKIDYSKPLSADVNVTFDIQHPDLIRAIPSSLSLKKGTKDNLTIEIQALKAGSVVLSVNATPSNIARFV